MIWNEEDIDVMLEKIQRLLTIADIEHFTEQAPIYIHGPNWTDELRIKNGFELEEGIWVKKFNYNDYWLTKMNDVRSILKDKNRLSEELRLARRKMLEMEYGLRVAQKSLQNSLALTKEMIDE